MKIYEEKYIGNIPECEYEQEVDHRTEDASSIAPIDIQSNRR